MISPENNTPAAFEENPKVNFSTAAEIYNAVYENAFHAMYIGSDDGYIFKFNEKLSRILGYSEKELKGKRSTDIFDINEDAFHNFIDERDDKGIAKAEITCIRKSGEKFSCRISSVFYETSNGERRSINTIVDISPNHFQ